MHQATPSEAVQSELYKLRLAVEQSPVATLIADTTGTIEYVSQGYTRQTGFTALEMVGRPITAFEPEYAVACADHELLAKIRAGGIWRGTLKSRRKNGTYYWETQTYSGIVDARGNLVHLLLSKENVSQRKTAELNLKRSEAFSRAIMESMTDALIVIDVKAVIVMVNEAWRRFTRESGPCPNAAAPHTSVDSNFLSLCAEGLYFSSNAKADSVRRGVEGVLSGDLPSFHTEYECRAKPKPLWFSLTVTPLTTGQSGAVVSNSNITERKEAELLRIQYQDGLERKVGDSTKQLGTLAFELMKTETRERRSLAEDLHDDLGQHLTVLKLRLSSLEVPGVGAESEQLVLDLKEIESIVDRSAQSVRSISTHLSPPILHRDGIFAALQWLVEEMRNTYGLHVNLVCSPHMVLNDTLSGAIYRTVRELLINVWKHANVDAADVTVRMNDMQDTVEIAVADKGTGFDVELVHTPNAKLSFGIYSIRERMHLIGGSLRIDSHPGGGTLVGIQIPFRTETV